MTPRSEEGHLAIDLFYAHIAGMDAFVKGPKAAAKMIEDNRQVHETGTRYSAGIGKDIVNGKSDLKNWKNMH